uniref:Intracellular signal transduction n=1 Tax=Rhipicephalus zambeziensis TaxID=60191 RepID=A0A224Z087_9ACAR
MAGGSSSRSGGNKQPTTHWLNVTWDDIVERLALVFYTDESFETLDYLNVMLLGWALFGLFVYVVGTLLANRFGRQRPCVAASAKRADGKEPVEENVSAGRAQEQHSHAASDGRWANAKEPVPFAVSASGADPDAVLWTNRVLSWVLTRKEHEFLSKPWIQALNEKLAKSPPKNNIVVEFEAIHPDSTKPKLHDAHVVLESKESLTITTGITCERLILVIKVTKSDDPERTVHRYNLLVEKLNGKLRICCISTEQLFVVRFVQRPDVKVSLQSSVAENKPHSVDQRALDDVVLESVVDALSYAVADISCSGQKDFPSFKHRAPVSEIIQSTQLSQVDASAPSHKVKHDHRLLVKVIKASNLGGNKGCKEVYCVVELDEPPHRCTTTVAKETTNPFWDEHFLFTLDQNSSEVLFEIYDKSKPQGDNFLGLGIVSISELRRVPSQRQIITLQSRPLEYDNVSGSLTVEFLYMEGSQIPVVADSQTTTEFAPHSPQSRIVEKNSRITSDGRVITTTTIKRSPTTETKTRDLEWEALLAIEEKLRLMENQSSPMKPLDESMVEFLRSQIASSPADAIEHVTSVMTTSLTAEPLSNCSDGSKTMASGEEVPVVATTYCTTTNASACPLATKDPDTSTTLSSDSTDLFSGQDGISQEDDIADDIPPPLPSSPPPDMRDADDSTTDDGVDVDDAGIDVDDLVVCKVRRAILTNGFDGSVDGTSTEFLALKSVEEGTSGLSSEEEVGANVRGSQISTWSGTLGVDGSMVYGGTPNGAPRADQNGNIHHDDGGSLAEAALKELEAKNRSPTATKSTLIIHSVQREAAIPSLKVDDTSLSISPSSLRKQNQHSGDRSVSSSCSEAEGEGGPEKPKKRTLLGKIRKRLSFKKNRSKSMEARPDADVHSRSSSRSVSTDRAKSVPLGRNTHLDVPGVRNNGSTRSSISEGSGISAASSRTYVSDKSLLVVEAKENGVIRHYLIPPHLAHRSKWRRKGVKLHIFNDHVFVAKHIPGGVQCHVCSRLLTRRLGKQGYVCRGCNLLCHKSCHVKTESVCNNSSVATMQMDGTSGRSAPTAREDKLMRVMRNCCIKT